MEAALLKAAPGAFLFGCEVAEGPLGRGVMTKRPIGGGQEVIMRVPAEHALMLCVKGERARALARENQLALGCPPELMAALEPEFSTAVLQGPALRKSSFGGARRSSMSSAPAAASAAADALVQPGWSLTPSERAGVLLHWATLGPGRDDRLAAYESTLPAADDLAVGLLLTDAEAAELQDPDLFAKVSAARARADAVADQVRDVLGDDPVNLDVANLSLSLARACSRTFGALDGALGLICPVADMMNHRFGPQCNFRLAASGDAFEFFSVGEAAAGEELHISYGEQLTNAELMLTYGFCVPGNPNETLGVSIDAAAALRAKGDRGGEEDPKERRQLAAVADALRLETAAEATAYLAAARRAVANSAATGGGGGIGGEEGGSNSNSPALGAVEAADACEATMAAFATSAEQDAETLRAGAGGARAEAAVRYRLERKRLLMASMTLLQSV